MQTPCPGCLHRTLSGLSQTHATQQHVGLSQTVRLYLATAANGQLTSNALPMGPGPERKDGAQQAAYLGHPSSSWGKDTLTPGPQRAGHLNLGPPSPHLCFPLHPLRRAELSPCLLSFQPMNKTVVKHLLCVGLQGS